MKSTDLHFFDLPRRLLAREPVEFVRGSRDSSRLLVIDRATGAIFDRMVRDIPEYLSSRDVLVLNNSQTIPSVLDVQTDDGRRGRIHLGSNRGRGLWHAYIEPRTFHQPGRRFKVLDDNGEVHAELEAIESFEPISSLWVVGVIKPATLDMTSVLLEIGQPVRSSYTGSAWSIFAYQNSHGTELGSVELPAAGRHFTPQLLSRIMQNDVAVEYLTLHTGMSNLTIDEETVEEHSMYDEAFTVTKQVADAINTKRRGGGKLMGVGTTVMRSLESVSDKSGVAPYSGWTNLFIHPGHEFNAIDMFVTNFHGPGTTRLALVMAYAGVELTKEAYFHAIEESYRFYEFGDAMLIV